MYRAGFIHEDDIEVRSTKSLIDSSGVRNTLQRSKLCLIVGYLCAEEIRVRFGIVRKGGPADRVVVLIAVVSFNFILIEAPSAMNTLLVCVRDPLSNWPSPMSHKAPRTN